MTDVVVLFDIPDLPIQLRVAVYREGTQLTQQEIVTEAYEYIKQLGIRAEDVDYIHIEGGASQQPNHQRKRNRFQWS